MSARITIFQMSFCFLSMVFRVQARMLIFQKIDVFSMFGTFWLNLAQATLFGVTLGQERYCTRLW